MVSTPTCCLLPKDPACESSAPHTLQIATSSVAASVWCGSGVLVDGKTEWSGVEVVDSLVCFAACGYGSTEGCHRGGYANVLLVAKGPCVSSALEALQSATSSIARAPWTGSEVVASGETEGSDAEVAHSLVSIAACGYGRRAVTRRR